jgi:thymidylate kinase
MMLIILEGPDGAGKSTLANKLALNTRGIVDIRHCSQLTRDPLDEYVDDLHMYVPNTGMNIIYDRHYLGELIYGPLYRDESKVDPIVQVVIEHRLNHLGALLVHVTHNVETLVQRCKDKGEDYLQEGDIYFVRQQFIEEVAEAGIRFKMTVVDAVARDVLDIVWLAQKLEERVNE